MVLKDCGVDAHSHVASCSQKPPGAADLYFGTKEQFERAQAVARRKKLVAFLGTLTTSDRKATLASIQQDLADLHLDIQ